VDPELDTVGLRIIQTSPTVSVREATMTPVLQPFLSEMPVPSKPRHAPVGTFTVARVSLNTSAPWSAATPKRPELAGEHLPKGVVANGRRRVDMSRHATVVLD
jgi:hypothetical protein